MTAQAVEPMPEGLSAGEMLVSGITAVGKTPDDVVAALREVAVLMDLDPGLASLGEIDRRAAVSISLVMIRTLCGPDDMRKRADRIEANGLEGLTDRKGVADGIRAVVQILETGEQSPN